MRLARAQGVNHAALASLRLGGGRPLPPTILARVNAVFGADFSHVRLHQDAAAARMAEAAQASAFTVGHKIWFNAGELDLGTPRGCGSAAARAHLGKTATNKRAPSRGPYCTASPLAHLGQGARRHRRLFAPQSSWARLTSR